MKEAIPVIMLKETMRLALGIDPPLGRAILRDT
jgi:hypothetical protein